MSSKVHVKKDDNVLVLWGADKGKEGKIISVNPKAGTVIVQGVNIRVKHRKPTNAQQQGGIEHREAPIDSSKVMLICNKCHLPTRVKVIFLDDGRKARVCNKCGEIIDIPKEAKRK